MKKDIITSVSVLLLIALFLKFGRVIWYPVYVKIIGRKSVSDVINRIGNKVEKRFVKHFKKVSIAYPPQEVTLIAYKNERVIELWGSDMQNYKFIKNYSILAESGKQGPKLRRGDKQIPEGIYRVTGLNPNSKFYLSLKLDYPNSFDFSKAEEDNRDDLGDDIFIHGKNVSIGCLAVGDRSIEELFVLADRIGFENIKVIIAPNRLCKKIEAVSYPVWIDELYEKIKNGISQFRNRVN